MAMWEAQKSAYLSLIHGELSRSTTQNDLCLVCTQSVFGSFSRRWHFYGLDGVSVIKKFLLKFCTVWYFLRYFLILGYLNNGTFVCLSSLGKGLNHVQACLGFLHFLYFLSHRIHFLKWQQATEMILACLCNCSHCAHFLFPSSVLVLCVYFTVYFKAFFLLVV